MIYIWRFLLLAATAVIAWRAVVSGVSSFYVEHLKSGDDASITKVLAWNRDQPDAVFRMAQDMAKQDDVSASALLARAYAANPANAGPLMAAAGIAEAQGDIDRADSLVESAVKLQPADAAVLTRAGSYWASRDRPESAMQYWSRALEANVSARKELFPVLLRIAEDSGARYALKTLALSPPSWWDDFFAMVSRNAPDVETLRFLYALRRGAPNAPLTSVERGIYVERLQSEGLAEEAYLVWINGLTTSEQRRLGLIFNGGFELELSGMGFDWRVRKTEDTRINRAATFGVDGEKALHLLFDKREKPFRHVAQPLFLDSGDYRVTGRVRTDSLDTKGGLKWLVRCRQPESAKLGESERFLGSGEWRDFSFDFQVSNNCKLQEIQLASTGERDFEHKIAGEAWFDGISIRRVGRKTAPASTETSGQADLSRSAETDAELGAIQRSAESAARTSDQTRVSESGGESEDGRLAPGPAADAPTDELSD